MTDRATGWAFVVAQILLLGTLILLPPGMISTRGG